MTLLGEGDASCDSCGRMMKTSDMITVTKHDVIHHLCSKCAELQGAGNRNGNLITLDLAQIAKRLYTRGLNVIPFKILEGRKIPLVKNWKKWQHERQLREEFETFDWSKADAIGIVCGFLAAGKSIMTLDIDRENIQKAKTYLSLLPNTFTQETPNGGLHIIYLTNNPPSSRVFSKLGIELNSKGKLLIVADRKGLYRPPLWTLENVSQFEEDMNILLEKVEKLAEILESHPKAKDVLFNGNWSGYKSRSEAEQFLVDVLLAHGFDEEFIDLVMTRLSKVGKWIEEKEGKNLSYHEHTLQAARNFVSKYGCPECMAKKKIEENDSQIFTPEELREAERLLKDPLIVQKIVRCVQEEHGVVGDERAILESFFTMLSALTREPLNMHPSGRAGVGKSFIVLRCAKLFPEDMIFIKSGMTKKSLYYSKWAEDEGQDARKIVLWGKVIICLEAENSREFIKEIKPNLSHDVTEYSYDFVEEEHGRRTTKSVKIVGWPSWIFISTRPWTNEEEKRRFNIMTPEADASKYRNVILRKARDRAEPWKRENKNMTNVIRAAIHLLSRDSERLGYAAPYAEKWADRFPERAESMTRFDHFIMLSQAIALLFSRQLKKEKHGDLEYVIIPEWVHEAAYELMRPTIEGLEKDLVLFAKKISEISGADTEGLTYQELASVYKQVFGESISRTTLRERYVEPLLEIGFLDKDDSKKPHKFRVVGDLLIPELEEKPLLSLFKPKTLEGSADSENKPIQGGLAENRSEMAQEALESP